MSKYEPPVAFSRVNNDIFRSSYPPKKCFPFIEKLNLKSFMYNYNTIN